MAEHIDPLDIDDTPDLVRLAEEVHHSHQPRVLRRDGEDLAMVVPLPRNATSRHKKPTAADIQAFRSAAGSWSDIDTDKLLENIYAMRTRSNPPPVDR